MLVLSRRKDEAVLIPDLGLTVKVLSVRGNQVRLGFDAPEFVDIVRKELHDARTGALDGAREFELALPR